MESVWKCIYVQTELKMRLIEGNAVANEVNSSHRKLGTKLWIGMCLNITALKIGTIYILFSGEINRIKTIAYDAVNTPASQVT